MPEANRICYFGPELTHRLPGSFMLFGHDKLGDLQQPAC